MKNLLPPDIISHKKQGFTVPLSVWFQGDLRSYAYDTLQSNDSKLYSYVNRDYVDTVLNNHQKGMRDFSGKLWSLLFFNEWLK